MSSSTVIAPDQKKSAVIIESTTPITSAPSAPFAAVIIENPNALSSSSTTKQVIEKPAILHETIREETVEEIQPVIHREYERTRIIKTTVPLYDKEIKTPTISQNSLAAQYSKSVQGTLPTEYESLAAQAVDGQPLRIHKEPIIVESTRHVVIEELRPVIFREIIYPSHVRATYTSFEGPIHVDESYRGLAHDVRTAEMEGHIFRGHPYERSYHEGYYGDHYSHSSYAPHWQFGHGFQYPHYEGGYVEVPHRDRGFYESREFYPHLQDFSNYDGEYVPYHEFEHQGRDLGRSRSVHFENSRRHRRSRDHSPRRYDHEARSRSEDLSHRGYNQM